MNLDINTGQLDFKKEKKRPKSYSLSERNINAIEEVANEYEVKDSAVLDKILDSIFSKKTIKYVVIVEEIRNGIVSIPIFRKFDVESDAIEDFKDEKEQLLNEYYDVDKNSIDFKTIDNKNCFEVSFNGFDGRNIDRVVFAQILDY